MLCIFNFNGLSPVDFRASIVSLNGEMDAVPPWQNAVTSNHIHEACVLATRQVLAKTAIGCYSKVLARSVENGKVIIITFKSSAPNCFNII